MLKRICNVCEVTIYIPDRGEQADGYETPMSHFESEGHVYNKLTVRKCKDCDLVWGYGGSADRPTCPNCRGKRTVEIED